MKNYIYNGAQYQFADDDVPAGAVLAEEATKSTVKKVAEAIKKAVTPANKARKAEKK